MTTSIIFFKNGRRPKKMEDGINLIGCDTIVNSPSVLTVLGVFDHHYERKPPNEGNGISGNTKFSYQIEIYYSYIP